MATSVHTICLMFAFLLLSPQVARCQSQPGAGEEITICRVVLISVGVEVRDRRGNEVSTLGKDDFIIY